MPPHWLASSYFLSLSSSCWRFPSLLNDLLCPCFFGSCSDIRLDCVCFFRLIAPAAQSNFVLSSARPHHHHKPMPKFIFTTVSKSSVFVCPLSQERIFREIVIHENSLCSLRGNKQSVAHRVARAPSSFLCPRLRFGKEKLRSRAQKEKYPCHNILFVCRDSLSSIALGVPRRND